VPPAFAALKYHGRNYYEYARAGVEIPRVARRVEIHALSLVAWDAPDAVVEVACSKGTYVRVLAEDLGSALGTGAHLAALRRTVTAGFAIDDAVTLDVFESLPLAERRSRLLPVDVPLADLARLDLGAAAAHDLLQGRLVPWSAGDGRLRAYGPGGRFLGLVECAAGSLRAVRLIATQSTPGTLVSG